MASVSCPSSGFAQSIAETSPANAFGIGLTTTVILAFLFDSTVPSLSANPQAKGFGDFGAALRNLLLLGSFANSVYLRILIRRARLRKPLCSPTLVAHSWSPTGSRLLHARINTSVTIATA